MKLQPLTLPAYRAKKELKQFTIVGISLSFIGLFVFWFLGIVGLALSARALILSFHESNKKEKDVLKFRTLAIVGVLFGIIDIAGSMAA